jgi:hypothetical protein
MKVSSFFALLCLAANVATAQSTPVDWQTLATEFSQDEAAASNKYQGQMITVTGPVSGIAQGDMTTDNPAVAVTLSSPAGPGPDVKCLFQNEDLAPNSEIYVPNDGSEAILRKRDNAGNVISSEPMVQSGQQIVVTGSFLEFDAGDIVLQHCRLAGGAAQ